MTSSGSNVSKGRTGAPVLTSSAAGTRPASITYTMRILLDRSVIEVYSQDGAAVLASMVYAPASGGSDIAFFASGIDVDLSARAYAMGSAYR